MNFKSEFGRSMVEMLGVLAIIGVLSIGGIAGYTLSMRRHRANQLLDSLNKYALVIYGSCQKAVLDGKITGLASCDWEDVPEYQDADVGSMTGFSTISFSYIVQKSGVDAVLIGADFADDEVCKTAKNIAGVKDDTDCESGLYIPFKMN